MPTSFGDYDKELEQIRNDFNSGKISAETYDRRINETLEHVRRVFIPTGELTDGVTGLTLVTDEDEFPMAG